MARIKPQTLLLQSKKKKGPSRVSVPTSIVYCLLVGVLILLLVATYRHWSKRSNEQNGMDSSNSETLNTPKGYITVELFKDGTPEIVDKFLDLWAIMGSVSNHVVNNGSCPVTVVKSTEHQ